MSRVSFIKGSSIDEALSNESRQYLLGDLKRSQAVEHVFSSEAEVGISHYREAQADLPHYHPSASEHQYVISGYALLRDLETDEIHEVQAGDFYSIAAGVAHVQKSRAGTRIIFFKTPGGDTKIPVEPSEDVEAWLQDLDF